MAQYLNIHESTVQSYIRPGGEVAELIDDVAKGVKTYSIAYLEKGQGKNRTGTNHVRSGRLLGGLFWNRSKLEGPLQGVARAGSSARHTLYFHDGTSEINAPNMVVPKRPGMKHTNTKFSGAGAEQLAKVGKRKGPKGVRRMDSVRGQWAKPFLEEGLAVSLANQRLK